MILLDACVLLNLCATDRLEQIGRSVAGGFSVCEAVREETLFLRDPSDLTHPLKPVVIDPLADWLRRHGPPKEVFFAQDHKPGECIQTDLTCANEL